MPAASLDERRTIQKEAIHRALEQTSGFVSALQLQRRLEHQGTPVGLTTIYRRLHALVESGGADTIHVPAGQLFRVCRTRDHHHHLICDRCGTAIEFDPPNETWIRETAHAHDFTVTRHTLEIFGICATCGT